jgi:hypothetical protein
VGMAVMITVADWPSLRAVNPAIGTRKGDVAAESSRDHAAMSHASPRIAFT